LANNSVSVTAVGLDQQVAKQNIINFLSTQDVFKGYNYAGSRMNMLASVLAYNTWLNTFYQNMAVSESFLSTATMESSIISHAKDLNYTPGSATSAVAQVELSFDSPHPSVIIQKGQTFDAIVRNNKLTFSVPDNVVLTSADGHYDAIITLTEGEYVYDSYIYNSTDPTLRYVITNANVDTDSLTVVVYENGSVAGNTYNRAETLLGLNEKSKVYFLQKSETGQYEVQFGDGHTGYRPPDGARILLDYRITIGQAGNGAENFTINFVPGGDASNIVVATFQVASSGTDAETKESVARNAPRNFQTQERAVSDQDYEIILKRRFPEIDAVSVFAGEKLNPPMYSYVVVAVDLTDIDGLPQSKSDAYYAYLKPRCPKTITPLFTSPERTYVEITSKIDYNVNQTTLTPENIKALVVSGILDYADTTVNTFKASLLKSPLTSAIDAINPSIISNDTDLLVYKKLSPIIGGGSQSITVKFAMPLFKGYPQSATTYPKNEVFTISSSPFYVNKQIVTLADDGAGTLRIVKEVGPNNILVKTVGTVNYDTGIVQITGLSMDFYVGPYFRLFARPASQNIASDAATILAIEAASLDITVNPVAK
jgi:hypothetical protein